MLTHFDLDMLRSFVTAQDLSGFTRAAETLNRSKSAVSQHLRKLELQARQPLVRRDGRALVLTPAGETLLAYARRLLALNDEAVSALHGHALVGQVRFGVVGDFADTWMPQTLALYGRAHPHVQLEATVDRASALFDAVDRGALDLVLAFGGDGRPDATAWRKRPQRWIGPEGWQFVSGKTVDLVLLPAPCRFRQAAIDQLEAAGIPWRVAFTGRSVATLWAAVRAGLGVTFRMAGDLPSGIEVLDEELGLVRASDIAINLHDGGRDTKEVGQLKALLVETAAIDPLPHP